MPRPLLWATTALLIMALALTGIRVLGASQNRAVSANAAATTIDEAIRALGNENAPVAAKHESEAQIKVTIALLLENLQRVIAPAEAILQRDAGGPEVEALRQATGRALAAVQSNRSEKWIRNELIIAGRDAATATDAISSQQRAQESTIYTQTLSEEIALVLTVALFVALGLRLAGRVLQRRMDEHAAELRRLAETDALTGAANRHRLADDLRELPDGVAAQALVIDLDGFKTLNDTHGHAAGDRILVDVATAIRAAIEDTATLYRTGGDEFCVIGQGTDPNLRRRVGAGIHAAVAASGVSASIGHAQVPEDATRIDTAITIADARMYEVKARDRASSRIRTLPSDEHFDPRRFATQR